MIHIKTSIYFLICPQNVCVTQHLLIYEGFPLVKRLVYKMYRCGNSVVTGTFEGCTVSFHGSFKHPTWTAWAVAYVGHGLSRLQPLKPIQFKMAAAANQL